MSGVRITGLDDAIRNLERLAQKAKGLEGTHSVPLEELLTCAFMRQHTSGSCASTDEWFARSPFKIEKQADFDAVPQSRWDDYVRASTSFSSMKEMLDAAGAEYVKRRLFGR